MNITDIFKIAEIKNAAAAEAQKFADTIKALNEKPLKGRNMRINEAKPREARGGALVAPSRRVTGSFGGPRAKLDPC